MTISAEQLVDRLIPAVPVPFDRDGRLHQLGLERYAAWMAGPADRWRRGLGPHRSRTPPERGGCRTGADGLAPDLAGRRSPGRGRRRPRRSVGRRRTSSPRCVAWPGGQPAWGPTPCWSTRPPHSASERIATR